MNAHSAAAFAVVALLAQPLVASAQSAAAQAAGQGQKAPATIPDLSVNWIAGGGRTTFNDYQFTEEGEKRFKAYDFQKDDPAYGCIGASWTRIWLNPNVVVELRQLKDQIRMRYEWMDIERVIPLVDPLARTIKRNNIKGHPALGSSAAWYDGDALVIDTIDFAPGYITTMVERAGLPQSRRMHTVERLRRDGDVLTIETTHFDPANYRTPVISTIKYQKTDWEIMKYGCTPEEAAVVAPR
jgi:hypothetical protein